MGFLVFLLKQYTDDCRGMLNVIFIDDIPGIPGYKPVIFIHLEHIRKPLTTEFVEVQIRQFAQVLLIRIKRLEGSIYWSY